MLIFCSTSKPPVDAGKLGATEEHAIFQPKSVQQFSDFPPAHIRLGRRVKAGFEIHKNLGVYETESRNSTRFWPRPNHIEDSGLPLRKGQPEENTDE